MPLLFFCGLEDLVLKHDSAVLLPFLVTMTKHFDVLQRISFSRGHQLVGAYSRAIVTPHTSGLEAMDFHVLFSDEQRTGFCSGPPRPNLSDPKQP
jgi:hypothetical protein